DLYSLHLAVHAHHRVGVVDPEGDRGRVRLEDFRERTVRVTDEIVESTIVQNGEADGGALVVDAVGVGTAPRGGRGGERPVEIGEDIRAGVSLKPRPGEGNKRTRCFIVRHS